MPKLYIICGHGAGDPGAVGGGQTEAERVRTLAAVIKQRGGDSVTVLDTTRNWYADKGINSLTLPKGSMLLELHRDSANGTARGAHVIIKKGLGADAFDNALAKNLAKILPGRSSIIVERSDLANANRAAARGINYRLAEVGFIDSISDRQIFDNNLVAIADAILTAAGITPTGSTSSATTTTPTTSTATGSKLTVDGLWGPSTTTALQAFLHTPQDGVVSSQWSGNRQYLPNATGGWEWRANPSGSTVIKALQGRLSVTADGLIGVNTIKALQRSLGVYPDGICGPKTVRALQIALNNKTL